MLKKILITYLVATLPVFAIAQPHGQTLIGQGALHYFIWHVYDAKLYSDNGQFSFDAPFSLELEYKRKLYGDKIADVSAQQIRKLGFDDEVKLAAWHTQMKDIFPDVDDGVHLTGLYAPGKPTIFLQNGRPVGTIKDPEFGPWFFGIWLDKKTPKPKLRDALLGNK